MNTLKINPIILTAADSETNVQAYIHDGVLKLLIDGYNVSIQEACDILRIDIAELEFQLWRHGLPSPDAPWRTESTMLQSYANEYIRARQHLYKTMGWSLPFLYMAGHAYELTLKCAICLFMKTRIHDLKKIGHNLSELRNKLIGLNRDQAWPLEGTRQNTQLITEFDAIYSQEFWGSKFFVRYPHQSHLTGKWPKNIEKAVGLVETETDILMAQIIIEFRSRYWPYSTSCAEALLGP
jgi:hypothetical protein